MTTILDHWPLTFVCLAMIAAAAIDGWKYKVPNWLTFPVILSGWALGLLHTFDALPASSGAGGVGAALAGTFLGFILLYPVHLVGGVGAGDVKMQMGFGSWVGAFYGLNFEPGATNSLSVIWWAYCTAVLIGGLMAMVMIVLRGEYRKNWQNTKEIVGDLAAGPDVTVIADKAKARKPRLRLLPYGIPLCIGFIGYLALRPGP